jgi:hypothetical protein
MSNFIAMTLRDASLTFKKTEGETRDLLKSHGYMTHPWLWADGVKRESVYTADVQSIKKSTFPKNLEFYRVSANDEYDYPDVVSYDKKSGYISLHVYGLGTYDIEANRCNTICKIMSWVLHLSQKDWFSGYLISEFIETCCQINGIKIDRNA